MPRYCLPYKGAQYWVRKKKVKLPTDHEIISRYTHRQLDVVLKETDSKIKKLTDWYLLNLTLAKKWFGIAQEDPLGHTPLECWHKMQEGNGMRAKDLRIGFGILCNELRRRGMLRKRLRAAQVEKKHRDVLRNWEMDVERVKRWIVKSVI